MRKRATGSEIERDLYYSFLLSGPFEQVSAHQLERPVSDIEQEISAPPPCCPALSSRSVPGIEVYELYEALDLVHGRLRHTCANVLRQVKDPVPTT